MEVFCLGAELFKTLADPKRLTILQELREGEQTVGDLARAVGIRLANASQHLAIIRNAGFVKARRQGSAVFYSLIDPRIVQASDIVRQIVMDRLPGRRWRIAPQRPARYRGGAGWRQPQRGWQ